MRVKCDGGGCRVRYLMAHATTRLYPESHDEVLVDLKPVDGGCKKNCACRDYGLLDPVLDQVQRMCQPDSISLHVKREDAVFCYEIEWRALKHIRDHPVCRDPGSGDVTDVDSSTH